MNRKDVSSFEMDKQHYKLTSCSTRRRTYSWEVTNHAHFFSSKETITQRSVLKTCLFPLKRRQRLVQGKDLERFKSRFSTLNYKQFELVLLYDNTLPK